MIDGFIPVFGRAPEFQYRSAIEYRHRHILAMAGLRM